MNKRLHISLVAIAAIALTAAWGSRISADDMGIFSVERRARVSFTESGVGITYALRMAEVASVEEVKRADADGDGKIDDVEKKVFFIGLARRVKENLRLSIARHPLELKLESMQGDFPPGEQNMRTVKADFFFLARLPDNWSGGAIVLDDAVFADRIGARQVTVDPPPGWTISTDEGVMGEGSVVFDGPKGAGPWSVRFAMAATGSRRGAQSRDDKALSLQKDTFKSLLSRAELSRRVMWALVLALFLGAAYALNPGHGRGLVSAYLVGERSSFKHAALLGWLVAAIRTTPVAAMGIVILLLDWYFLPLPQLKWLNLGGGLIVAGAGAGALIGKWRGMTGKDHPVPTGVSAAELIALALSGGLIPSATAIALLFAAVGFGHSALGLGMVVAFGAGLECALTAMGYFSIRKIKLGETMEGLADRLRGLSIVWGAVILGVGVKITLMALDAW